MRDFFPMTRGDFLFILGLLLFAVVSFLPVTREARWAGMSMLGWMMAALMVLSPSIALARLIRTSILDRGRSERGEG